MNSEHGRNDLCLHPAFCHTITRAFSALANMAAPNFFLFYFDFFLLMRMLSFRASLSPIGCSTYNNAESILHGYKAGPKKTLVEPTFEGDHLLSIVKPPKLPGTANEEGFFDGPDMSSK